ncbi:unnamed protein product [Dovyalis caffra]|uniref:Uncharacterized protein n=1 Tax=Dovyalis caffra TaxID=77055 RepID=A0AAV1SP03_9ROSI|nr:unnamed protein product [Dovyalis caffra]
MMAEVTPVVVEVTPVVGPEPMVVEVLLVVIGATMKGVEEEGNVTRVAGKGVDEGMGTRGGLGNGRGDNNHNRGDSRNNTSYRHDNGMATVNNGGGNLGYGFMKMSPWLKPAQPYEFDRNLM